MSELTVRNTPCAACPYRKDAPSGLWHRDEYRKLPDYDLPTGEQPIGAFLCHDGDRESVLCRGWAEVHSNRSGECELLSIRIAANMGRIDHSQFPLKPCGVPLHESGAAACAAGIKGCGRPSIETLQMAAKLVARRPELLEASPPVA